MHMVQHMVLNMLTPVFLVLGAPDDPAAARPALRPGGVGRVRRGLLRLLHSRLLTALTHPAVTFVLFITSLYGLYFTPVFDKLMSTWWGHNLMLVHFLIVGFLYFWSLLGSTPTLASSRRGPRSLPGPMVSVMEIGATAPFHAFFGVAVMMSTTLLVRFYAMPDAGLGHRAARGPGLRWRHRVGVHRDPDAAGPRRPASPVAALGRAPQPRRRPPVARGQDTELDRLQRLPAGAGTRRRSAQ